MFLNFAIQKICNLTRKDPCSKNKSQLYGATEFVLFSISGVIEAFLRSDNAGCYHCDYLMLSLSSLADRVGITIKRYDFSDPQAGKDVCDCRKAVIKSHMRCFINEGHEVRDAKDMKTAIESYGNIEGCFAAVVRINTSTKTMEEHLMTGIQSLNNFFFDDNRSLKAWKANDVGQFFFVITAATLRNTTGCDQH